MFRKPIFYGYAPNQTMRDVGIALGFLLLPWQWPMLRSGKARIKVEQWLSDYTGATAVTFDSGRTALHIALQSLGVGEGDEVFVQGYTCMVVSNAINWTGATPVYVDIGDDLNMDTVDLEKKITDRSKVLIIQHTFGNPADLDALLRIAKKYNLRVIEDCAHAIGGKYKDQLLGTFGDIGIFSFGSDKVVSCVRGGAAITGNASTASKLKDAQAELPRMSLLKVLQHLMYYPTFAKGKALYSIGLGKMALWISKKLNLMARIMEKEEKRGNKPAFFPAKLPNSLASILHFQLANLKANLEHRNEIASIYRKSFVEAHTQLRHDGGVMMSYPLLIDKPLNVAKELSHVSIHLGTQWTGSTIVPRSVSLEAAKYKAGECPRAENLANKILELPTHKGIEKRDAERIARAIASYV